MTVVTPLPELLESLRAHGLRKGLPGPMDGPMNGPMDGPMPGPVSTPRAIPTGHAALDAALRSGGWPRGSLALLDAPAGSGATTLALGSLAAAQAAGGVVAYLDTAGSLDPSTAARLGINLDWLLVVRPSDAAEAVELAAWLARERRIDAMVLDLAGRAAPARDLERLASLLVRSDGVTLLLTGVAGTGRAAAGVRVALRRHAWLAVGSDLVGQRVEAVVERHRWALAGGRAELDLFFAEGRRVDALLRAAAMPLEEEERVDERPALRVVSA
jgi:RecA/RadA recombinase